MSNDHEDLLRDGHNMPIRGATAIEQSRVVVGFRSQGQVSIYCGEDPVFQFNAKGEIRRVYFQGDRYAANQGKLHWLKPTNDGAKLQFQPVVASHKICERIFSEFDKWRERIGGAADWEVADIDDHHFVLRLRTWLETLPHQPNIASEPNA